MWYQHLKEFLTAHDFLTDHTLPCIFIYKSQKEFVIVAAYVDDLNLIGTDSAITRAKTLLTAKFQVKFLGPTTLCLGLQVKHLRDGSLFLHQTAYTQRVLKRFNMDQAHPLSAPLMGRSKTNEDSYSPCEEEEDELDKPRYLAAVGALLYLATYTRPDISFAVSVLSRHSQRPTSRHWAGVKHLLRYLRGTEDLGLHYTRDQDPGLTGYADAGYKSDVKTGKSQTGYIFIKNNAPISWKSSKQTITATSTNHSELLAFHEATRELVWLHAMDKLIMQRSGLGYNSPPTVLYEDNAACINQLGTGFIKADRIKHIDPQIFSFTQDLVQEGQLLVKKIESENNIADMFTKSLPEHTHRKLVKKARMRSLHELN